MNKEKTCTKCGETKPLKTGFPKHKNYRDGFQNQCLECFKRYAKARYHKNKSSLKNKIIERQHIAKERNCAYIKEYLLKHPCVDCGESRWIVLEFDHVRGEKRMAVGQMVHRCCSIETIRQEIEKCEVRCANCHRLKTAEQLGYWKFIA